MFCSLLCLREVTPIKTTTFAWEEIVPTQSSSLLRCATLPCKMVYKVALANPTEGRPMKRCISSKAIPKYQNSRLTLHKSSTTGLKTRSYQRYNLRSTSTSSSQKYHMDNDTSETTLDVSLWNDGFEDLLIDMLYDETLMDMLRGGRITNNNNVRLAEKLSATGRKKFNSDQVKGKVACLKRRQRAFTDLMKQTGLGWDPERQAPVASEEHWANALRVRPSWKNFNMHGCPNYEKLCAIFGCSIVIGTMHRASTDPNPDSDDERLLDAEMQTRGDQLLIIMRALREIPSKLRGHSLPPMPANLVDNKGEGPSQMQAFKCK